MSDVIKINPRSKKAAVKVAGFSIPQTVDETDLFKSQLEEHYKSGFEEGYQKASRELEQDYSSKLYRKYEEVYNVLQSHDEHLLELERLFEKLVIQTAYELSKKILKHEIEDKTIINENIKAAINKIIGANEVRLKLNPLDLNEMSEASKNLIHNSSFNKISIEGEERIERGGCLIETEIGNVDARISTQLNELRKKLEESV